MVRPGPHGPRLRGDGGLRGLDDGPRLGPEPAENEGEVEGEMQLVASVAVETHDGREVGDPRLAQEHSRRVVFVRDRPPPLQDVVHLGSIHVVDGTQPERADRRMVVLGDGRVVAEVSILHQAVRDVDPEPGDAAIQPVPQDFVERLPDLLVPPVQVRLLGQEVVEVVLRRSPRPTSRPVPRTPTASCSEPNRRGERPPTRTSPGGPTRGPSATRRTTGAGRSCGSGRGRGSRGCRERPPPRRADRAPRDHPDRDRRSGSRRRRNPSRRSGTGSSGSARSRRRRASSNGRDARGRPGGRQSRRRSSPRTTEGRSRTALRSATTSRRPIPGARAMPARSSARSSQVATRRERRHTQGGKGRRLSGERHLFAARRVPFQLPAVAGLRT